MRGTPTKMMHIACLEAFLSPCNPQEINAAKVSALPSTHWWLSEFLVGLIWSISADHVHDKRKRTEPRMVCLQYWEKYLCLSSNQSCLPCSRTPLACREVFEHLRAKVFDSVPVLLKLTVSLSPAIPSGSTLHILLFVYHFTAFANWIEKWHQTWCE